MEVCSDRRYRFDVEPATVWAACTRTDDYQRWWPWLRSFEGERFAAGERWTCRVQPPVPYSLAFSITLDEVVEHASARASIAGDITCTAEVRLRPDGAGTELHLVSRLAPASPLLQAVARIALPVAQLGHDWVLDTGLRQFRDRAL